MLFCCLAGILALTVGFMATVITSSQFLDVNDSSDIPLSQSVPKAQPQEGQCSHVVAGAGTAARTVNVSNALWFYLFQEVDQIFLESQKQAAGHLQSAL